MNKRIAETAPQARHVVCYFFMESVCRALRLGSLGGGKKTVNNSVELESGEANPEWQGNEEVFLFAFWQGNSFFVLENIVCKKRF